MASSTFRLPDTREQLIAFAQLAEQSERYDEMSVAMRRLAKINPDLSSDERQMLSVAYKHLVTSRRASWRVACSVENAEERQRSPQLQLARNYRKHVEDEISEICRDFIDLLDKMLLPAAASEEAQVFYHRLLGDYRRYLSEISASELDKEQAHEAYTKATELAAGLGPLSPIKLGLALNFAIFYYEVLKAPDKACQLARQAYEDAIGEDDSALDEEERKETAALMQLLRDNLYVWTERDDAPDADA